MPLVPGVGLADVEVVAEHYSRCDCDLDPATTTTGKDCNFCQAHSKPRKCNLLPRIPEI